MLNKKVVFCVTEDFGGYDWNSEASRYMTKEEVQKLYEVLNPVFMRMYKEQYGEHCFG